MTSSLARALAIVVALAAVYGGFVLWRASRVSISQREAAAARPTILQAGPMPLDDLDRYPLIERSGANFKFARLAGHVWVADVFFSSCPHECKMLTAQLRSLQIEFADLRLASITCDPDKDTPERLRRYADENGAQASRWYFLTGKMYDIQGVCQQLFGHAPKGIEHSRRVAVVDRHGNWHGMYDVFDEKEMTEMRALLTRLLAGDTVAPLPVTRPKPPEPAAEAAAL